MSLKTVSVAPGGGGGNGTVTNVSITTANGVSGAVANSTTTPAITLTLGDITPTKVTVTESVGSSALVLTGATQTASFPVLNATQTWSNSSATFTAVKLNVTDSNSASGSLLMDLQVGTVPQFNVRKDGYVYATGGIIALGSGGGGPIFIATVAGAVGYNMASGLGVGWTSSPTNAITTADTIITRRGIANLRFGAADAASPVAQTLSVQSIVGGISTDASAAAYPFKITGAQGTGTGAGGSVIIQTAPAAGSSGNGQNTLTDALTVDSVGSVRVVRALTVAGGVATLPGTPLAGMIARVSDALAPAIGTTVTGGGAAYALVNYNGANWTVIGV
jgi:hypothetical protein